MVKLVSLEHGVGVAAQRFKKLMVCWLPGGFPKKKKTALDTKCA